MEIVEKEKIKEYGIGDTMYQVSVTIGKDFVAKYNIVEHTIKAVNRVIKSTVHGDELVNVQYETSYKSGNNVFTGTLYNTLNKHIDQFIKNLESSKEVNSYSYKSRMKYGLHSGHFYFGSIHDLEKFKIKIVDVCGLSDEQTQKIKNAIYKLEASISNREKLLDKSHTELNNLKKLLNEHKKSKV
jgi:hypothetical protein